MNWNSGKGFLVLAVLAVLAAGTVYGLRVGVLAAPVPPPQSGPLLPDLAVLRVEFLPEEIGVVVQNTGPIDTSIAAVQVAGNGPIAIRNFIQDPEGVIARLETVRVTIPYNWIPGVPYTIKIITSDGTAFAIVIPAAVATMTLAEAVPWAVLLGLLVGIVPVTVAMLCLPVLRRLDPKWSDFLRALGAGVLTFFLVETVILGNRAAPALPLALGLGVVALGFFAGLFGLVFFHRFLLRPRPASTAADDRGRRNIALAFLITAAVGLHNFGDGLGFGGIDPLRLLAFAAALAVAFALNHVWDGVAVISPVSRGPRLPVTLPLAMILLAGVPAILGAFLGFTLYADAAGLFLGVATGAMLYVVAIVATDLMSRPDAGKNPMILAGFLSGFFLKYVTEILFNVIAGQV